MNLNWQIRLILVKVYIGIEVSELPTNMTSDERSRYEDIITNYVASYTIAEG